MPHSDRVRAHWRTEAVHPPESPTAVSHRRSSGPGVACGPAGLQSVESIGCGAVGYRPRRGIELDRELAAGFPGRGCITRGCSQLSTMKLVATWRRPWKGDDRVESGPFDGRPEVARREAVAEWSPVAADEHQVTRPAPRPVFGQMASQFVDEKAGHRDRPPACPALRVVVLQPAGHLRDRVGDGDRPTKEVDVLASQRDGLGPAQAQPAREEDQGQPTTPRFSKRSRTSTSSASNSSRRTAGCST